MFDTPIKAQRELHEVLLLAAQLHAQKAALRMPAAIHVATTAQTRAGHFISGDAGIRALAEGMQRVQLRQPRIDEGPWRTTARCACDPPDRRGVTDRSPVRALAARDAPGRTAGVGLV